MVFATGGGKRVLVVGGGLTAAALSSLLRSAGLNVVAWDKARRPGGRLTTHRRPGMSGHGAVQQVDLGGQYISVSGEYRGHHAGHYHALVQSGLLKSLSGKAPQAQDREEIGERASAVQGGGWVAKASRPVALDHLYIKQPEEEGDPISLVMTDNYVAPLGTEVGCAKVLNRYKINILIGGLHQIHMNRDSYNSLGNCARLLEPLWRGVGGVATPGKVEPRERALSVQKREVGGQRWGEGGGV